jgi:hypothetical protein
LLTRKIEQQVARTAISHGKDGAHRRVRPGRSLIGNGFLVKKNFIGEMRWHPVQKTGRLPDPARVSSGIGRKGKSKLADCEQMRTGIAAALECAKRDERCNEARHPRQVAGSFDAYDLSTRPGRSFDVVGH